MTTETGCIPYPPVLRLAQSLCVAPDPSQHRHESRALTRQGTRAPEHLPAGMNEEGSIGEADVTMVLPNGQLTKATQVYCHQKANAHK
jgi:hypothetical protein